MQENSLAENLRLAQEYQKMQTTFLTEKDNFFKVYDKQLPLEAAVSDKKQVLAFILFLNRGLFDLYAIKSSWLGAP